MKFVIVQNCPTQFDAPLYALMNQNAAFVLTVFYTEVEFSEVVSNDPEIAIVPQWNHLLGLKYNARFDKSAFSLWRQIVALRPDHVIICGWYPRVHALLALLLRVGGIRIGVRSDNTLQHTDLSCVLGLAKRVCMSLWLGLFHAWHPVGSLARGYLEKISLVHRPVFYFPYAINVDWFAEEAARCQRQRLKLRESLGLAGADFIVLGVMKWIDREAPLTLVDAWLKAAAVVPNLKLLLVGDGPLRDEVARHLSPAPTKWVTPGYVKYSDLPSYYAISDLFVHPAQSEPYGVSVQEAMACGLPVITSSMVGAATDFLELGINGDVFPVDDVDRLAELLINYSTRDHDASMSDVSRRKAEEWSYRRTMNECQRCIEARL